MDNKMIAKKNKIIEIRERISSKLNKMFSSKIGEKMAIDLGYIPLHEYVNKYGLHYLSKVKGYNQKMNLLQHAVAKSGRGNITRFDKLIDYTKLAHKEFTYEKNRAKFVENYQKNKYPIKLSKFEQKLMNKKDQWDIKIKDGKPMIKFETNNDKTVYLYDKESGIPYYCYTPKNKKLGLSYKIHAYEIHKMNKYDKRAEEYKSKLKRNDLFPEMYDKLFEERRDKYLHDLRITLSDKYWPRNAVFRVYDGVSGSYRYIDTNELLKVGRSPKKMNPYTEAFINKITQRVNNNGSRVTCVHMVDAITKNKNDFRVVFPTLKNAA